MAVAALLDRRDRFDRAGIVAWCFWMAGLCAAVQMRRVGVPPPEVLSVAAFWAITFLGMALMAVGGFTNERARKVLSTFEGVMGVEVVPLLWPVVLPSRDFACTDALIRWLAQGASRPARRSRS